MEKRPTLRFLAGREDAGSTPDPAAPKLFGEFSKKLIIPLMGHSYFIECQKCDYKSEEITMGVGFLFGNIDDILHALRGNDKKIVQLLKHRKQIHTHYSRGYSLYQCSKCHSLENKCHLTLYNQQGDLIFQTESYCRSCQKAREYMPEDSDNETIPDLCCPKCHQQDLKVLLGILWD